MVTVGINQLLVKNINQRMVEYFGFCDIFMVDFHRSDGWICKMGHHIQGSYQDCIKFPVWQGLQFRTTNVCPKPRI